MREQSDAGNRLAVFLGADVYREAMPQAYRIAAEFLFHMPTGVGYGDRQFVSEACDLER
jgi:hypothetical protein